MITKSKFLVVIMSLVLVQCTSEQKSWEKTKTAHNRAAYEKYLKKYPEGMYSDSARVILEDLVFKNAVSADSVPLFESFIQDYPQSQFVDSAKYLIEKIHFNQAKSANTEIAYKDFLKQYPEGTFAKKARHFINNLWIIKDLTYTVITEISGSSAPHTKLFKKAKTGCIIEISGLFIVPESKNATVKFKDITLSGESSDRDKKVSWEMSPLGSGMRGKKGCSYHFMDHMIKGAVSIKSLSGEGFELAKDYAEDPGTMTILGKQLQLCLAFAVPKVPKNPLTLKFGYNEITIE